MKIELDNDLILPIATVITALVLTTATFFISVSEHNKHIEELVTENQALFQEVSIANHEIAIIHKKLQEYQVTEEYICSLGATHTQAKTIIKASEALDVSPKY